MMKIFLTLAAIFIANLAHANAPDTSLRPMARPDTIELQANQIDEINCLALNIYHESRSEKLRGMIAVAQVTMNRVEHEYFPETVCDVVFEPSQFSWTNDGHSDKPTEKDAWLTALDVADLVYYDHVDDPTQGSLFYHTTWSKPVWRHRVDYFKTIGTHKFYLWDGDWNND